MEEIKYDLIDIIRDKVSQERQYRGWSRKQLAMKAGVSANTVFLLEHDNRDIYLGSVINILEALGMKLQIIHIAEAPKRSTFRY